MRHFTLMCVVVAGLALGCEKHDRVPPPAEAGREVDVKAPGVDVKVDPQEGVDVKTPAVDVETERP